MDKGYRQLVTTVTAQLLTWIPVALVVFKIRATPDDVRVLAAYIAPFVAGIGWFAVQYRRAGKMADEQGSLPRPEWFWSLITGRVVSHPGELGSNRQLTVVSLAQDQQTVEHIVPSRVRNAGAIGFFTLERDGTVTRRGGGGEALGSGLDAQSPVGLVLVDGGAWEDKEEYDQAIRAWGARNPELPIVAVATAEVSAPGGKPSLRFSSIPWESLQDPPLLGITNRLLQQAAIRGNLWRRTAERFRYLALGGIAAALLFAGLSSGLLAFSRRIADRSARDLACSTQYRQSVV